MTKIRPYRPEDLESCLDVFRSNIPAYFNEQELADFRDWLMSGDYGHYYVVEQDDRLLGCGGFYISDEEARFCWGMIAGDYHGKGIGRQLSVHRLDEIKRMEKNLPVTLVTAGMTVGFFERMGFYEVERTEKYYEGKWDRVEMRRDGL